MHFCQNVLKYEDVNEQTHGKLVRYLERKDLGYKLILMPRGHLKTSITTIGYSLYSYLRNNNVRILIVNYNGKNARSFMRSIQHHIQGNKEFRRLYGENENGVLTEKSDTWNQWEIVLPRSGIYTEPTIRVSGLTSSSVSQHYDIIILDDLVNRENIGTSDQLDKTLEYYKDYEDLLEPDGTMIVIGTRWHWGDLYGWLQDNAKDAYREPLIMQAVANGDVDKGKILFPQKFTRDKLKALKAIKGDYNFSCQYLNSPTAPQDAVFQKRWFRYYRFENDEVMILDTKGKELQRYERLPMNVYISVDPAISERKSGDFTGISVVGIDTLKRWYVLVSMRLKLRPSEVIPKVLYLADTHNAKAIGIEGVAFAKSLVYDFEREVTGKGKRYKVIEIRPETSITKDMRIAALQPMYSRGQIFHPLALRDGDLETELLHHPRAVHDDLADSMQQIIQIGKAPLEISDLIMEQPNEAAYARTNSYTGW